MQIASFFGSLPATAKVVLCQRQRKVKIWQIKWSSLVSDTGWHFCRWRKHKCKSTGAGRSSWRKVNLNRRKCTCLPQSMILTQSLMLNLNLPEQAVQRNFLRTHLSPSQHAKIRNAGYELFKKSLSSIWAIFIWILFFELYFGFLNWPLRQKMSYESNLSQYRKFLILLPRFLFLLNASIESGQY